MSLNNYNVKPNRAKIKEQILKIHGKTVSNNFLLEAARAHLGLTPGENLCNLGQWLSLRPHLNKLHWKLDDIIRLYFICEVIGEEENDFQTWSLISKSKKQSV